MEKRGLSAIVVTVLIILITIAATTIIWSGIIPLVRDKISFEEGKVELNIEGSSGYTIYDEDAENVTVQVRRGADESKIIGIEIMVNIGGTSEKNIFYKYPEPNQAILYEFGVSGKPDSISVAPIFSNNKSGIIISTLEKIPKGDSSKVSGVTSYNEPKLPFTLVVLPDTQAYVLSSDPIKNMIFTNQTQWIVDNKEELNIKFVMHVGDFVQWGSNTEQWDKANLSMSILDGKVPYLGVPGNHDYDNTCNSNGTKIATNFNNYFPSSRFNYDWFGESFPVGKNNNNYGFFSNGNEEYLVIGLEFCPSTNVLNWASEVITNNSNRKVIVFTHTYLGSSGTRTNECSYNCCEGNSCNGGIGIWNNLIQTHSQIFLVLNGHARTNADNGWAVIKTDNLPNRNPIHQVLQNWQWPENSEGNGWLMYYTFNPSENIIQTKAFSPYLNQYNSSYEWNLSLS